MYKLICMSFDGDFQRERDTFETVSDAWEASNDLGSKWYFYPFHFVVTESGKTIKDSCYPLDWCNGKRLATVRKIFSTCSQMPVASQMDAERYADFISDVC